MRRFRYFICDVFTEAAFGGNQLAVLPEADGLSDTQMQRIAREFNFAETTFVFPPVKEHTRRVRIFTPSIEVPFAGHPNIGTAFVLASAGLLGEIGEATTVTFEEKAGMVPVSIQRRNGRLWCELSAPEQLTLGAEVPVAAVASAVSLAPDDFRVAAHAPRVVSVGMKFVMAEVVSEQALARARIDMAGFEALREHGVTPDVHLYTRGDGVSDLRARMFAPLDGVFEDAGTGSANCALAAFLAHLDPGAQGTFRWRVRQGVEMGRPSLMEVAAEKRGGAVTEARVGGNCALFAEGTLMVDEDS